MVSKRLERFLIHLDKVGSTNDYANNLLKTTKVLNGTIVLADHQSNGKGQRSNTWTTQPGKNLTCSIILLPDIQVRYSFYLNVIVSLAVRKVLADTGIEAKIKWPNDILFEHKKVSGILIENQISGQNIASCIIGIGLNVNQEVFDDLPNATSLKKELNIEFEIREVLNQLVNYLDFYYSHLLESNFDLLKKHYYEHLYKLNESTLFKDKEGEFEGKIIGIDEQGKLVVQSPNGKKVYDLKEVSY